MTAIELMTEEMNKALTANEFVEGSLVKESIMAHIRLANDYLSIEKSQLDAEYQRSYDKGNYDASNMNQYE